eukprot:TRINITY_DN54773_c0_g1_i1.p1 TRINITY_DN54773_c0_g1~~TRINITY_DN54773_c0_g1_i1.p1  ORF type:complete len:1286 (+),score=290.34 TRINITY_DN54773_c0_g1_i1:85-3942(+)
MNFGMGYGGNTAQRPMNSIGYSGCCGGGFGHSASAGNSEAGWSGGSSGTWGSPLGCGGGYPQGGAGCAGSYSGGCGGGGGLAGQGISLGHGSHNSSGAVSGGSFSASQGLLLGGFGGGSPSNVGKSGGAAGSGWANPVGIAGKSGSTGIIIGSGGGAGAKQASEQIIVSGCQHATVAAIVHGGFTLVAENHGKPVYKKDTQVPLPPGSPLASGQTGGLDVMLYFWDERDGQTYSGWWFGPKVGGDQVWAYHPEKNSSGPPLIGWKVPYDGPVDSTFRIETKTSQDGWDKRDSSRHSAQESSASNRYRRTSSPSMKRGRTASPRRKPERSRKSGWDEGPADDRQKAEQVKRQQEERRQEERRRHEEQMRKNLEQRQQQEQRHQGMRRQTQEEEDRRWQSDQARRRADDQQADMRRRRDEELKRQEQLRVAAREELRRQEENRRVAEETKKKAEETRKKEQLSALTVRRVIQKLRSATPENADELKLELDQVMEQERPNLGSQEPTISEEIQKGTEVARVRVEEALEKKRKEQELKEAEEKQHLEAEARADDLVAELGGFVGVLEAKTEDLTARVLKLEEFDDLSVADVENTAKGVDEASEVAKVEILRCSEFVMKNGPVMKRGHIPRSQVQSDDDLPQRQKTVANLLSRISEAQSRVKEACAKAPEATELAVRTVNARATTDEIAALFKRYDRDNDGLWSKCEVMNYSKQESQFPLSEELAESVLGEVVENGAKGVSLDRLHRLKIALGIARERARDRQRVAHRLAMEEALKDVQQETACRIKKAQDVVERVDLDVRKAEEVINPQMSLFSTAPDESINAMVDESLEAIEEARAITQEAKRAISDLSNGLDKRFETELRTFVAKEAKHLVMRTARFDLRLKRLTNLRTKLLKRIDDKRVSEIRGLRSDALRVIRFNQRLKKFSGEDLFKSIRGGRDDGEISQEEFLAFFERAVTTVPNVADNDISDEETKDAQNEGADEGVMAVEAKPEVENESDEKGKQDDVKIVVKQDVVESVGKKMEDTVTTTTSIEPSVDQSEGAAEGAMALEEKPAVEKESDGKGNQDDAKKDTVTQDVVENVDKKMEDTVSSTTSIELSVDQLKKVFHAFVENGSLNITNFANLCRVYMKVVKETALTTGISIRNSQTVRRLDKHEVAEVLKGPAIEKAVGVQRVWVQAMKDEAVGWVTVAGNQGTEFLKECGRTFEVVKETILTNNFVPESAEPRKEGETEAASRKLQVGDVLDVITFPKKEEGSGEFRLQGKVRGDSDGEVGWATATSAAGVVYLVPV